MLGTQERKTQEGERWRVVVVVYTVYIYILCLPLFLRPNTIRNRPWQPLNNQKIDHTQTKGGLAGLAGEHTHTNT